MPVSRAMWMRSVPPSRRASAENSSAFLRFVTVWVMSLSASRKVYSGGVCPRISSGAVIPPSRSSIASSRQDTAR